MDLLKVIALGVLQGVTEFLPISSSGHLVLAQQFFGLEGHRMIAFDVCLHFGTLLAVFVYFRWDLIRMASAAVGGPVHEAESYLRRWWWLLCVATVPVGVVGLALAEPLERAFSSVTSVGFSLLVTAVLLLYGSIRLRTRGLGPFDLGLRHALVVGLFQAVAIVPGISRSGATIVGGLAGGLDAPTSARFAFLLSIPAILAAMLGNLSAVTELLATEPAAVGLGIAVSAVTGGLAIELMMRAVRLGRLLPFAVYCGVLGLTALSAGWLE